MSRGLERGAVPNGPPNAGLDRNEDRPATNGLEVPRDLGKPGGGRRARFELTETQQVAVMDIGRFRTVSVGDIATRCYASDRARMRADLERLQALGLVQRRTAFVDRGRGQLHVVVLTKAGKRQLERMPGRNVDQAVYAGFVKPAEVVHDAAIYRMFQEEAARLKSAGARITRVMLDFEFKKRIYSPLAKARRTAGTDYAALQLQVATANCLKVVDGKIPLPDLRIEYINADGTRVHIDLELATHHYHGSHLRTKIAAGFKLFTDSRTSRTAPLEERGIASTVLSF